MNAPILKKRITFLDQFNTAFFIVLAEVEVNGDEENFYRPILTRATIVQAYLEPSEMPKAVPYPESRAGVYYALKNLKIMCDMMLEKIEAKHDTSIDWERLA